jgi:hypothetical protein
MKTVRKLSARSNEHFLRVVGQAAQSTRQAAIARSVGLSETTISRLLRTQEAREAVDTLRAQALTRSWEAFDELLGEALDYLRGALKSPLVGHQTRVRVALKLLEFGLTAGALPSEGDRQAELTIVIPQAAGPRCEKREASGDADTDIVGGAGSDNVGAS